MENPLFLFPHLNISSLKEKTHCKVMKSTNKEETNKEIKTRSKEKRNRLSLLLQKAEFHENVNLEKFENLTKASSGKFEINEEYMQLDIFDKEYMEFYKKDPVSQNNMTFEKCLCVTPEEAVRWGESFNKLLSQKAGLDAFTSFLKTEFSEENIEFWTACEDYKKNRASHQLLPKAKTIYETFIRKDAPKEVNLDFHTKEVTAQNITHPTLDSFDAAQAKIYRLMEQDSYPRFLRSDMYLDLIKGRQHSGHPALRRRSRSFTFSEFQDVQSDFTIWL